MSVKHHRCVTIHCDEPGCDAAIGNLDYGGDNDVTHFPDDEAVIDGSIHNAALDEDWFVVGDKDYCPEHGKS
jgi:hypothetical protein